MASEWQVEIISMNRVTPDWGVLQVLAVTHQRTGLAVSGVLVEYNTNEWLIDEIISNYFRLPTPTLRRLLHIVYGQLRTKNDGEMTNFDLDLIAIINSCYLPEEGASVLKFISRALCSNKSQVLAVGGQP